MTGSIRRMAERAAFEPPTDPAPAHVEAGVNSLLFRRIMSSFPTGVTVVTTLGDNGVSVGLTANAVTAVSLTPPQLLVCLGRDRYTCQAARERGAFAVNFLDHSQRWIAERFASGAPDKFADTEIFAGRLGLPLIAGALAHAECVIDKQIDAGDHMILIGCIRAGEAADGRPLMFYRREYGAWPSGAEEPRDR